jgi:hypothetical protein
MRTLLGSFSVRNTVLYQTHLVLEEASQVIDSTTVKLHNAKTL